MLPPQYLSATKPRKSWVPDEYELDSDWSREPDAVLGEGATDSEFSHQRFRNSLYVEFVGPRKTLAKLRNLCLDWLQPETRSKAEIVELLVLEQFLTILPERIKPWVCAKRPGSCEKLVTLLENYKRMYEPDDDNSDITGEDSMSRKADSPPPRPVYFFSSGRGRGRDRDRDRDWERERDRDWDQNWDHERDRHRDWDPEWYRGREREREREQRGRERELELERRERWAYSRSPRGRLPQRDLSLPALEREREREQARRDAVMECECSSQDADSVSYQDVVDLAEDRKPQNPIQDNMENYRKLLSLGVQLAENDGHSHMTQGHSSRSKRSAYPSTSRGLKTMPETKRSTHRRGICEDESSHGVIMEKFIKDVSRNSKSARAREASDRPQRFSRRPDNDWRDMSFNKRESVIQERGYGGHAFGGGGIHFHSSLVSRRRVLERKRRYHFDSEAKGSAHEQKSYARKRAFECSEMRKALSMGNLSAPSFTESHPVDFASMPYVCDECGRCFSVISEFVEHQIMHTRENLYEYGESFIHSVAVSEVQKRQSGGKRFECKECGETFNKSAALAEHRKNHTRQQQAEPKDDEYEEPFMPSPTFSELQKMYGKDKFYECKVCKETFLHSSALIEHQKTHGRGNFPEDKDRERGGESFKPSPSLSNLQKMYGKDKLYECKICGETFHHSSSLKEHQKIHARGKPFENKPRVCEATYIPGQKRHQKTTYPKEKLCDFDDGPGAFMPISDVKLHSRKNLYEARGYEKPVIHSVPYTESQKSHTITRPPEDEEEEEEKAFTVSSNPEEKQKLPIKGNAYHWKPYEMSVIHSLAFAESQKSHSAVRPIRPRVIAESTIVQSSGSFEHQRVRGGDNASEGRKYERSVIHSLAAFKRPRSRSGYEFTNHNERGESSVYISDLTEKPPKILVREHPYEVGKSNSYKGSVIHSVSHTKPQKNLTGEGSSDFLKDGEATLPSSTVREHQKARAKKKNIEGRNYETSVIHSLHFGEPRAVRPREKFYECQVCGESFIRNSDLTEHQKIHEWKKPSGSKNYERSVIRSLASTDPQPSYAEPRAQTSYAEEPPHSSYIEPAAHTSYTEPPAQNSCGEPPTEPPVQTSYALEQMEVSYAEPRAQTDQDEHQEGNEYKEGGRGVAIAQEHGAQQKRDTEEKPQAQKPFGGDSVIQSTGRDGPQLAEPRQEQPQQEQPQQEKPEDDEDEDDDEDEEDEEDSIYGCKDCGLGFADKADLKDHQKVHGRDYLVDTREYKPSVIHSPPVSEYQRDFNGEQLFECPACGESFVHSSFLFEHQKIHEQDQYYGVRRYEEPFMQPLIVAPRRPRPPQKNSPPGLFLQCQVCGEDFIHASVLNDHMRVHVGQNFAEPAEGETSEQATSSSLALTEYQRSQAEERQCECRTCGAAFLSQSDLAEHMRIHEHDNQPYDYGASFVHTSFLTEPPKRDSPFYECKDCGKSFIHNTVLTKHQKLHVEEEEEDAAAATQEVEANVLVPREVLRIQGSNVEAAEPEVEAAEPEVEAAEPEVEAAEPNGEAEGPEGEAAEPNGEAEQPNDEAEQPAGDADEPDGAGIEDPEERAEEPEGDADEPDGVGIEDPEEEGEEQEAPGEAPFCRLGDCGETCASGQHLKAHARVILFEPGPRAGTSGDHGDDDKYFKCDVCGQLFSDRLALARHQNSHTG